MVATFVKIESLSFSSAEIQHFRTENMRSDYNYREYLWFIVIYRYKLTNDHMETRLKAWTPDEDEH